MTATVNKAGGLERSEYLSEILDVNVIFWKAVKKQIAASKTEQTLKKKKD